MKPSRKHVTVFSPANMHNRLNKLVEQQDAQEDAIHRVVVKSRSKIHVIPVETITYLEAQDDYVMIYTHDSKHLKQKTMKYFESPPAR